MSKILQTRLYPAKIPENTIPRDKLCKLLQNSGNLSLILISAPAGYGKTTLTLQFLENGINYSWLNISSEMDNFYIFMEYLIHSVKCVNKDFGNIVLELTEDYSQRYSYTKNLEKIIKDITDTFVNDLFNNFNEDFYIILDDLGNIENSGWQRSFLNCLFENMPSNIHLIITTRTEPDLNATRLQAKRKYLKIDLKDLSFTLDETIKLVRDIYGFDNRDSDIKILLKTLDGWITGMHLVLQSYGSSFKDLHLDKIVIFDDVFNYFTEDIFLSLSEDVKSFLMFTSLLEYFTPHLCNTLLNRNDSEVIINELLNKNIFININNFGDINGIYSYSYQALFKKFLNLKIKEGRPKAEIDEFLIRFADISVKNGDNISAINYLFEAGSDERAIKLVNENFQGYFDSGNYYNTWIWLEKVSPHFLENDYRLLYYKSLLLKFFIGNIEQSISYINSSIELCRLAGDNEFLVKCCISKARNLISLGKIKPALGALLETDNIETDNINKAKLKYLKAYIFYQDADYEQAIRLLDEASALLEMPDIIPGSEHEIKTEIFNLFGHIYLIKGYYSKSISYYERVANSRGKLAVKYETYCNLVLLYSQSAKFDKAMENLNKAEEISRNIAIPIFRITYLLAEQAFKYEFGDYEDAILLLAEMNNIASELNHKYYIFLSYSLIGDCYLSLNKPLKAEEYFDLAFKYLNDGSQLEKIQYSVSKALMLKITDPISEIEPVLLKAYEFYESNEMLNSRIQIAFHLADYYRKIKQYERSIKYLKEALNVSEENEYNSFIQREIINFRSLFDLAIANNIRKKYVLFNISTVKDKWKSEWISSECSMRLLDLQDNFFDLRAELMGKNDIFLRGRLIDDALWNKKKWKTIFIYLLLSPNMTISKDKIIDMFYPDTQAESADNIFHQMISKFRNLLKFPGEDGTNQADKPKAKKGSSRDKLAEEIKLAPSLIIYEDKTLKIDNSFYIYSDVNEFETLYKQLPLLQDKQKKIEFIVKAIKLYKGDFMESNYDTWCEELRSKYFSYFTDLNEQLIKLKFSDNDFESTINFSENFLKYEKLSLTVYEYLLNSLIRSGKKQEAKIRYTRLMKDYKSEYDESIPLSVAKKFEFILEKQPY